MNSEHYYKYRSLSNLRFFLDILIHKRLYMATYDELNDPMEGAFLVKKKDVDNAWLRLLRSEKNVLRVCSLSSQYNHLLMWTHYADSNKGCCIELEVTSPEKIANKVIVNYTDQVEAICSENLVDIARKALSRKLQCWKYEDEVRFLKEVPLRTNKTKFLKIKIHKIYLGLKISQKEKSFYKDLINKIDDSIEVVSIKKNDLIY